MGVTLQASLSPEVPVPKLARPSWAQLAPLLFPSLTHDPQHNSSSHDCSALIVEAQPALSTRPTCSLAISTIVQAHSTRPSTARLPCTRTRADRRPISIIARDPVAVPIAMDDESHNLPQHAGDPIPRPSSTSAAEAAVSQLLGMTGLTEGNGANESQQGQRYGAHGVEATRRRSRPMLIQSTVRPTSLK